MQNDRHLNRLQNKPQHPESIVPTIEHQQSESIALQNENSQMDASAPENKPGSILMAFDEAAFNKEVEALNGGANYLGKLQATFLPLNLGPLQLQQMPELAENPREFVFKAITKGEPLTIGRVKISSAEARHMVELPEELEDVEKLLKVMRFSLPADPNEESGRMTLKKFIEKLEVNGAGEIVIKPGILDGLRERFELRAETDFSKAVFKASSALRDALKQNKSEFTSQNAVSSLISNLFVFDSESREISINYKTILAYNRPLKHSAHGLPYRR